MSQELTLSAEELHQPPAKAPVGSRLRLAWRALLLDESAYAAAAAAPRPFVLGLVFLLYFLGIVIVARLVGHGLGWLTSPRLDSIQALLQEFVVGLPWYTDQARQVPDFAAQFALAYGLSWDGIRTALGIPTVPGTGITVGALVLETFLAWLAFGTLAHGLARWFGGPARYSQTLGALALAYAPLLLLVVEAIPGASVPLSLLFLWMLMGKFLAIKQTHTLTTGYALAATLLPYLVGIVLLVGLALFGGAFGIDQVPYAETLLGTLRSLPFLPR